MCTKGIRGQSIDTRPTIEYRTSYRTRVSIESIDWHSTTFAFSTRDPETLQ